MSEQELCGQPTKSGKPCNMPKDHQAGFHRHREYPKPMKWQINDGVTKEDLGKGVSRVDLGYAVTRLLAKHTYLIIEVKVGTSADSRHASRSGRT